MIAKNLTKSHNHSTTIKRAIRMMNHVAYDYKKDTKESRLFISQSEIPEINPETEYLLKTAATCLNRADMLQKRNLYNAPPGVPNILGLEAVGYRVNPETLEIEDASTLIAALLPGCGYSEYVKVKKNHTIQFDASLVSIEQAAAVPEAWLTSYLLLRLAQPQKGDNVYVNAGASGIGTSAVQMIRNLYNAQGIVSCSSQEKVDFCLGVGATKGVAYKGKSEEEIIEEIKEITQGGCNVALDCVGPNQTHLISSILKQDSRWVLYGLLSGAKLDDTSILRAILTKRISLIGSTLRYRSNEFKADLVKGFNEQVVPGFETGVYKPVIDKVYEVDLQDEDSSQIVQEAHDRMESNQNTGKIVLRFI